MVGGGQGIGIGNQIKNRGRERGKNRENTWLDKIVSTGMGGLEALVSLEKIAVPGNMNFLNQLERIAEWGIPFSLMVVMVSVCNFLLSFFLPELLCRVGGNQGKSNKSPCKP